MVVGSYSGWCGAHGGGERAVVDRDVVVVFGGDVPVNPIFLLLS